MGSVDGKRFLMLKVDRPSTSAQLTVVLNWFEELEGPRGSRQIVTARLPRRLCRRTRENSTHAR